jgi:hypothetical protein
MTTPVDLRDERAFPTFGHLPSDEILDLNYFTSTDGSYFHPKRHWCLLAEITEVGYFLRLRLTVRDKSGAEIPVAFHVDNAVDLGPTPYQTGHTIAVLYAHQHGFLDGSVGIRQEDLNSIQVSRCQAVHE